MKNIPRADSHSSTLHHIVVREIPIELCQFIKFAGMTASGGEAKHFIGEGQVLLNGIVETRKRKKLISGDRVKFCGQTFIVKLA